MKLKEQKTELIPIDLLECNTGQIDGVPANPRKWTEEAKAQMKKSLEQDPELLQFKPLLVYPISNGRGGQRYAVVGGNLRLTECIELQYKDLPCMVLPKETTKEQLMRYVLKDNVEIGENDWEALTNWPEDIINDSFVDITKLYAMPTEDKLNDLFENDYTNKEEKLKFVVNIPNEYKDNMEDIKNAISVTLQEWKGCSIR